jgi:hypothetical protein
MAATTRSICKLLSWAEHDQRQFALTTVVVGQSMSIRGPCTHVGPHIHNELTAGKLRRLCRAALDEMTCGKAVCAACVAVIGRPQ